MTADRHPAGPSQGPPPPFTLKIFQILSALLGLYNIYRFVQVLVNFQELTRLDLGASALYLGLEGLLWGASGLFLAWSIRTRRSWTTSIGSILSLLYAVNFWIDRAFISQPELIARRWPINLVYTVLGLALALSSLHQPISREYFKENPAKIP